MPLMGIIRLPMFRGIRHMHIYGNVEGFPLLIMHGLGW